MRIAAKSEPAPGSEKPWHQISSLRRIAPMMSRFWSSLPSTATVGAR